MDASPAKIARAVQTVLGDPAYRDAAQRAAKTIASERERDVAADALEQLAGAGRPAGSASRAPEAYPAPA